MEATLGRRLITAELAADGGAAASSAEFFRCGEFLAAEGVTHSLLLGDNALPLIVRPVPGGESSDAISPYGYPGAELRSDPPEPGQVDWSATVLVSVFLRDRLDRPSLSGGTERGRVQVADPELPRKSRMSDRQQVRRNEAAGYGVRHLPGPETSPTDRDAFRAAYAETMSRTQAAGRYLFSAEYFDRILASGRTWLFLCDAPGGGVAAGSIAALSDGYLHYYLSGTSDERLAGAPMKNILEAMISFAEELGAPLNLGGGIQPGDGLEEFKRGFANREQPFITHELVADVGAYGRLSAGRDGGPYFPAYRAP